MSTLPLHCIRLQTSLIPSILASVHHISKMKFTIFTLFAAATLVLASPLQPGLEKRAVTCLKVGSTATATWKNAAGKTCRWTGTVGSNFGTNSATGGEYVCPSMSVNLLNHCYSLHIMLSLKHLSLRMRPRLISIATPATAAAAQDAPALRLATHIHRTASVTISAVGSTTLPVVLGKSCTHSTVNFELTKT